MASRLELCDVSAYERPEDGKVHTELVFEIDMAEGVSVSSFRKRSKHSEPGPSWGRHDELRYAHAWRMRHVHDRRVSSLSTLC